MSALPSAGGGYGALHLVLPDAACHGTVVSSSEFLPPRATAAASAGANKRKRRPAGTPDPGAEVVALSPKTLMESDRYVCEICNQGFQRDQNLQMHRRRHKVPWKLLKRSTSLGTNNKRVYICPERSCLHHDPAHALGDLVGIKKHYRRKHCTEKQWKCDKCSKGYAVQSDYKAHLKTCGTRGHCCDCGRVFSRVESFIEHQDTCSAVKHKAMMQSGGGNDRAKSSSAPRLGTDRSKTSTGSPSQSSDTTQAMSIAHSAMSDTTKTSAEHTKVTDSEHSRRIQASQAVAATPTTPAAPAMPPWLTDHARRSELELLPSKHRQAAPTDHHHSKPQAATRQRISINFPYPEVSCPESKYAIEPSPREPSLQLSMGPCGVEVASSSVSPFADTKPSFSSVEKFLVNQKRQTSASNVIIPSPRSADLALSVPDPAPWKQQSEGGLETDRSVSLSGFLNRRIGDGSKGEHESSTRKQLQQNVNSRTEMVANYNPCVSISSYHEDLAANVHESDAPGPRVMSRRFTNSQLEPATSSVISNKQASLDHRDVAEPDHFFAANSKSMEEAFRSQKHMTAGSARAEATQAYQQARTDMNAAWSDEASMRLSKDEARQECDAAQRDITRAEILKREAREQLQFAAAERAYAERAREVAKRQIELSEAELSRAKRLREHAQFELANAKANALSPQPIFCHSCKSALESNKSPPNPSTWSFMTPAAAPNVSDQAPTGMSLWPSERFTMWPMSTSGINIPPSIPQSGREQSMITPKLDLDLN